MSNNLVLTPSAVNNYLKAVLEKDKHLSFFKIKGEVSNFKKHSNGNYYFSIKDEAAQINCIMFKSYAQSVSFEMNDGLEIEIDGSIYLYTKMGQYNINVRKIQKSGVGDLYVKYNELKLKLEKLGYFDLSKKKPIPKFPERIGVITSSTGAAVEDIITTIQRRFPICKIILIPTLVQGAQGAADVAKNIRLANEKQIADVLIVGRGGGSIEDLWNFNEEIVITATFESEIPIISSVGHETDTTLIDFASDLRAPTPTAAAELATPDLAQLKLNLNNLHEKLPMYLKAKVDHQQAKLQLIENNQYFIDPLLTLKMNFSQLENNYFHAIKSVQNKILINNTKLNNNQNLLKTAIENKMKTKDSNLLTTKLILDELNPLTILSKGYSVTSINGTALKSIEDVQLDTIIETKVNDGQVVSKVIAIKEKNV